MILTFNLKKWYLAFVSILKPICPYCSDLGAHIDGFCAVVAHTIVVGASADHKVTGRKADTIMAAHLAAEAALRLVKPGTEVRRRFI